jgi:hypothetical protein
MSKQTNPSYRDEDYEGYAAAGLPAGVPVAPVSADDLRALEAAWNNPRAYELSLDEGFVGAGYVPKPNRDPSRPLAPTVSEIESLPRWARVAYATRCVLRIWPLAVRNQPTDATGWFASTELYLHYLYSLDATIALDRLRNVLRVEADLCRLREAFHTADVDASRAFGSACDLAPRADPQTDPAFAEARSKQEHVEALREQIRLARLSLGTMQASLFGAEELARAIKSNGRGAAKKDALQVILVALDQAAQAIVAEAHSAHILTCSADSAEIFRASLLVTRAARSGLIDADLGELSCAELATRALLQGIQIDQLELLTFPRRDFERLSHQALAGAWTDSTPVLQDAFGPMWGEMAPPWWFDALGKGNA